MSITQYLDVNNKINYLPHVVILGAGASLAAFPDGDATGKRLPLMNNLVETIGLSKLLEKESINYLNRNFEDIYSEVASKKENHELLKLMQSKIKKYFYNLKLPKHATLYDRLILSLRKKDIIATFNWDPLLMQAYKRNVHLKELPQIVFLHGNTYIGICRKDKIKGYVGSVCLKCGAKLKPSQLLYPISDKKYTEDLYIKDEWNRLSVLIKNAYLVTIFGYSIPKTDVAARKILVDSINCNKSKELLEIEIIDIKDHSVLANNWKKFNDKKHYTFFESIEYSFITNHPRRTCEALAFATLQQDPLLNSSYSKTNDLKVLQAEAKVLIQDELSKRVAFTPFENWEKVDLPNF
ncbi:MAG: hypothetical protein JXR81_01775 [Candidatus Goldbacteria bacterium]|nr:hypothetical protein [Candidatus Goldiibacteriota bacterium]